MRAVVFCCLVAACARPSSGPVLDATGEECKLDSDCVITKYNRRVRSPDKCVCTDPCGDSLPKRLAKEYEKQWKEHCRDGGQKGSPLQNGCPEVECREKVPAVCDHGRCGFGAR